MLATFFGHLKHVIFLPAIVSVTSAVFNNEVRESCPKSDSVCKFKWVIEKKETMVLYDDKTNRGAPVFATDKFYMRPINNVLENCGRTEIYDPDVYANRTLFVGDGTHKYVYTINGDFPGPSIVVYEGTTVQVTVTNKLHQEGIGIHWHGMHQKGTPWMDGVPSVSHCAILPDETFTYRFVASPNGTHWYHSHLGLQRSDGLFGALIVLPDYEDEGIVRDYDKDFVMLVNDWYPGASNENFISFFHAQNLYQWTGYNDLDKCSARTVQEDSSEVGTIPFFSSLVNGKGRRYNNDYSNVLFQAENSYNVMSEVFKIARYGKFRFRVINAGLNYALRISIDGHLLRIFASDGYRLLNNRSNIYVDDLIVQSGERVDFYIDAESQPMQKTFWVRAEPVHSYRRTSSTEQEDIDDINYPTVALIEYTDVSVTPSWPEDQRTVCTNNLPCKTFNCPFKEYRPTKNIQCINFGDSIGYGVSEDLSVSQEDEYMFSFHFPYAEDGQQRSAINGIQFVPPSFPPHASVRPYTDDLKFDEDCSEVCKGEPGSKPCSCTHTVSIKRDKMTQFVFVNNILAEREEDIEGTAHPVHLHGHAFYVVRVGYAEYDEVTKKFKKQNSDIVCLGNNETKSRCSKVGWANGTMEATIGQSGINIVNPPIKDTITVPPGGYVVVRFKADNPGWWLMHCHIELHLAEGMGVVIKEASAEDVPKSPAYLPKCGSFDPSWDPPESSDQNEVSDGAGHRNPQNKDSMAFLFCCVLAVLNHII